VQRLAADRLLPPASTGLLGLAAYLYFHYTVFAKSLTVIAKSKKINQEDDDNLRHIYPVLGAAIVSFAITNFFGFSVIPVYLMMVLIATLPTAIISESTPNITPLGTWYFLLIIPLLYPLRLFLSDVSYAKGKAYLDANQPQAALPLLQKAANSRPGLDLYHSVLGEAYANLGETEQAVKEAELTKRLNPYHLNFHKSRAKIYLTLASKNADYYQKAAAELEDAVKLAPTDPKLFYNLGLIYSRLGKNSESIESFKKAISLKPNYESPYYALTLLYEQTDQKNLIKDLLTGAKQSLATYSGALKEKVNEYIH
jgi:tetratricopeptide (TPR) repeat protein